MKIRILFSIYFQIWLQISLKNKYLLLINWSDKLLLVKLENKNNFFIEEDRFNINNKIEK